MKVWIILQNRNVYAVFATDELAQAELDKLQGECSWFDWEVISSVLIG